MKIRPSARSAVTLLRWCTSALGVLVMALSTPLAYYYGKPLLEPATPQPSDVIVLLSSGQISGPWLTPDAMQRTAGALLLYRRQYAPLIISSGSTGSGDDQAGAQADWLVLAGVPAASILVERQSTRTRESVVEISKIMRQRGLRSAVVVTSQMDVPRVRLAFARLGIAPSFLAVPEFKTPPPGTFLYTGYQSFYHATYEYAALLLYKWKGWI